MRVFRQQPDHRIERTHNGRTFYRELGAKNVGLETFGVHEKSAMTIRDNKSLHPTAFGVG